jgi:hypothetical protein
MWYPEHLSRKIRIMGDFEDPDIGELHKYLENKWSFLLDQHDKDDKYRLDAMLEIANFFIFESGNGLSVKQIISKIENGDIENGKQ